MSEVFLTVVNMSISASWIILAVLILRLLLRKAPKWIIVLLWAIAAVRLICPFTVESVLSLIPSAQTVSPEIMMDTTPEIYTGVPVINNTINPIISEYSAPAPGASANPMQIWIPVLAIIWVIGIAVLLVYEAVSYWRIKRKVASAILYCENIFQSENVGFPFVLGIIKPKIYLPFSIREQDMEHVIAHEQAHIRRKDHLWKPLGFLILTLHWFNPLIWLGYVLLCRDIELACDEKVIKELNTEQKADYSQAILTCSVNRRIIAASPLAFGEVGVKERVKSVLSYKRPAFWIIMVAVILSIAAAVCFLTNPAVDELNNIENLNLDSITEETVSVWVTDGETYYSVCAVSEDLLLDLFDIRISDREISMSRSEDRDKSHTVNIITKNKMPQTDNFYLSELQIHFNKDFTSVWVNTTVKPTLSYRVMNPQRAKEVYENIRNHKADKPSAVVYKPTNTITSFDIKRLREEYPMYFDLDAENGLEVYIWQMAEGSYSCGLLTRKDSDYTQEELWDLHKSPASLDDMRIIVAYYLSYISKDDVSICPIQMPHSSYAYKIDEKYREKITENFWSDFPIYDSAVIDAATFDIDSDGIEEYCVLRYGPTSGLFTFCILAYENDRLEYFNIFNTMHMSLSFETNEEGQTILVGRDGDNTYRMSFDIRYGNIVILNDDLQILYWGMQGPYSSWLPRQ